MSEVEQLFQCVICGKAYAKKQSLRAHLKAHKGEYMRTSIQVKKDPWAAFNKLCEDHKTTTCHVLNTLVEGILEGAKTGNIDLPKILSPNPLVINLTHVFMGRPRSSWKVDLTEDLPVGPRCPACGSSQVCVFDPVGGYPKELRCGRCGAQALVEAPGTIPEWIRAHLREMSRKGPYAQKR